MTFDKLRFVASSDIGDLGPKQGVEVVYNWRWYYNIPSLTLWLILLAALVFIRDNRTPHILLILVPFLIVNIAWFLFSQMMDFSNSTDFEMFDMMFYSLVAATTFLWLFAPKLGRYNPRIAIVLAFTLIVLIFLAGIVSYIGFGFSDVAVVALIMLAVSALAMLLGFVLAGWRCRKHYGFVRFMLWLAFWMVIICLVSMIVFYLIALLIRPVPIAISTILFLALIVGLILAVCIYVINLPYMILAQRSSFFRKKIFRVSASKSGVYVPQTA
jgi:MFS family permease